MIDCIPHYTCVQYLFLVHLSAKKICGVVFTSIISCTKMLGTYINILEYVFFPDLVVARLSSACCSWRCRFPSSPVSLRLIQLSQYLGRSMVSPFPHSSKFPLFYVSLHPMGQFFASFSSPFLLGLETMGPAYRTFAGMMICLFFAVALMILAGVAYIFNSWQDLAYVSSFPFIALFR